MNEHGKSEVRRVVLVGADGSAGASEVLRWAAADARLRKARATAIWAARSTRSRAAA